MNTDLRNGPALDDIDLRTEETDAGTEVSAIELATAFGRSSPTASEIEPPQT